MNSVLSRLPFWSRVGAIGGAIVGVMTAAGTVEHAPDLSLREVVIISIISGTAAWLFSVVMLSGWLRYRLGDVVLMTLLIVEISAILTVYLADLLEFEDYGPVLGFIVGMIVGAVAEAVLCRWCACRHRRREVDRHA